MLMERLYRYCCLIQPRKTIMNECPICLKEKVLVSLKRCKHYFCVECITKWVSSNVEPTCPLCRNDIIIIKKFKNYYAVEIL